MENNNKQQVSSNKLRSKILRIIPKAAAAVTVTFQNPPFSPGRDHHHHKVRTENGGGTNTNTNTTSSRLKPHGNNKGFSGPIVSMIPDEARRKSKHGGGIETQEPTSPKVSCIGQIKHKKKNKQIKEHNTNNKATSLPTHTNTTTTTTTEVKKKQVSNKFQRMFFYTGKPKTGTRRTGASSLVGDEGNKNSDIGVSDYSAPPIGHMRRFASGRETFSNFDWRAQIAPEEINHRDCYSEDDRAESDVGDQDQEEEAEEVEEDEVIIPFSAPIGGGRGAAAGRFGVGCGGGGGGVVGVANLQPRKEINLWKRRTMAPPRPLQLNPVLTAK